MLTKEERRELFAQVFPKYAQIPSRKKQRVIKAWSGKLNQNGEMIKTPINPRTIAVSPSPSAIETTWWGGIMTNVSNIFKGK
ncbi:MAG TPA: hypothetical protein VFV86_12940 [Nitrososphaeraceae archaeon]|nr:hypothetical protein [Nitrososphaeraceae archaeon]